MFSKFILKIQKQNFFYFLSKKILCDFSSNIFFMLYRSVIPGREKEIIGDRCGLRLTRIVYLKSRHMNNNEMLNSLLHTSITICNSTNINIFSIMTAYLESRRTNNSEILNSRIHTSYNYL